MSSKRRGRIDSTWCISPASAGFGGVGQCHLATGISNKIALQILLILVLEMGNQGKNIVTVSASPTPVAGQKALSPWQYEVKYLKIDEYRTLIDPTPILSTTLVYIFHTCCEQR